MSSQKTQPKPSIAICIPVLNRGKLFKISFASLLKQLKGLNATIWVFDNGSDNQTRKIIERVTSQQYRVHKVFFPENMGIPYAANVFAKSIMENCDYVNYVSPQYIMIMDSDAFFKKPIEDLVELCREKYQIGLISGHDSIEHASIGEKKVKFHGKTILVKEKRNERMISMIMKKEEFIRCYPFPHYRNRDVDWEITQWNPNSMKKRNRRIFVAPGYVLHLGIDTSTWNRSKRNLHSKQEIEQVRKILRSKKK